MASKQADVEAALRVRRKEAKEAQAKKEAAKGRKRAAAEKQAAKAAVKKRKKGRKTVPEVVPELMAGTSSEDEEEEGGVDTEDDSGGSSTEDEADALAPSTPGRKGDKVVVHAKRGKAMLGEGRGRKAKKRHEMYVSMYKSLVAASPAASNDRERSLLQEAIIFFAEISPAKSLPAGNTADEVVAAAVLDGDDAAAGPGRLPRALKTWETAKEAMRARLAWMRWRRVTR